MTKLDDIEPNRYARDLLDEIDFTGYQFANSHGKSDRAQHAIRHQTRLLIEFNGQHPEVDLAEVGNITFAIEQAKQILKELDR